MIISITSSELTPLKFQQVEEFLKTFLPRLKQVPGVINIYHYARPEKGDESTLIIWENDQALKAYRTSDLAQEAVAFGEKTGGTTTREAYPIIYFA